MDEWLLSRRDRLIVARHEYLFSVLSQSSSSSSFVLDHTVPYGTALLGGVFPGTSCQATIAPSLRDNSQQALASVVNDKFVALIQ